MSDTLDEILAERKMQHGDFSDHARYTQSLKNYVRQNSKWSELTFVQQEAIEMIIHKLGRIMAGDPNHRDHWDDIAGYARLVAERISPKC